MPAFPSCKGSSPWPPLHPIASLQGPSHARIGVWEQAVWNQVAPASDRQRLQLQVYSLTLNHILWLSMYGAATETHLPAESREWPLLWLSVRTFGKTCAKQLRKNKVVKFTVWVSPVQNKQTYSSKMLLVSLAIEPFWKRKKTPQKSQCSFKFWRTLGVRFSSQNTANSFFRINLKSE